MAHRKRPAIVIWVIPLLIGFAGLNRVMLSPAFEVCRAVDIVHLVLALACASARLW